jgi:hypothetical protein
MPSNKKPRKPFDPKKHQAKHTHFAMTAEQANQLKLPPRVAYQAFLDGAGSLTLWRQISVRLNVLTAIVKPLPEWHDLSHHAALAMVSARDRAQRLGKWGFTAPEAKAVVDALNACDDAQDTMRRMELEQAYQTAYTASKRCTRAGVIFAPMFGALSTGAPA